MRVLSASFDVHIDSFVCLCICLLISVNLCTLLLSLLSSSSSLLSIIIINVFRTISKVNKYAIGSSE